MARSRKAQSAHDKKVQQEAKKLKQNGFDVSADVTGFPQPETVNGYRPDVVGKKGKQKKIIEVETPNSKGTARDKKQQQAFRNAANRNKNTTFRRAITDN